MDVIRGVDLIFTAKVVALQKSFDDPTPARGVNGVAVFDVETVWKGSIPATFRMEYMASGPACGWPFRIGERVTVGASQWGNSGPKRGYWTGYCTQIFFMKFDEPDSAIRHLLGVYREETAIFQKAIEQRPRDLQLLKDYASFQSEWGDRARVVETHSRILELHPTELGSAGERARALFELEYRDEALAQVDSRLSVSAADVEAQRLRVSFLLRMGRASEVDRSARDFRGAQLEKVDLVGWKLDDGDFRGSNLNRATLGGASLHRARFDGAVLEWTDLSKASLKGSSFVDARIRSAHFRGADLRNANFRGATISFADFSEADLAGADFSTASNMEYATLSGARYSKATRWPSGVKPKKRGAVSVP